NQTVKLNANESRVYNFTWNTSFPLKPGKNYTILAVVENRTKYTEPVFLGGPDLAVTNISMKPVIWDGDLVLINATINNFGSMNASRFNVTFYEVYEPDPSSPRYLWNCFTHYEEINTTQVKGLPHGNSISISVPWNWSIRDIECKCKDGAGRPAPWIYKAVDDYKINVTIEPLANPEQAEETNNTLEQDVHVNRSRDFFVTNLSFEVNGAAREAQDLELYDIVTTNATINYTNLANQPGMVNLSFYIDKVDEEHEIGNGSITFGPGNGTGYAEIEWTVDNLYGDVYIPGDHNIIVRVDPEQKIYEINDFDTEFPNNDFTWAIHVKAPELVFEKFNITPETLVKGDNATINVTIANRGRLNTTRNFNLTIYDWAERHIEDVSSNETYCGFETIEIERANATAMRLYLDLAIEELTDPEIEVEEGGEVCVNDGKGMKIKCYNHSFHGWTPWILGNKSVVKTIRRTTISKYLFCWDNVPGNESERLIIYLTDDLGLEWAENAEIVKTDDNIRIFTDNNSANLTLDVRNGTVILEINGSIVEDNSLIVKERSGARKIYTTETCDTDVYAKVCKVYSLTQSGIINTTTHDLAMNENASIPPVEWTAPTVGERLIAATIDPEDVVMEYNESNNLMAENISVQTADLEVSNLTLWFNGSVIADDDTMTKIIHGDNLTITANVTNIGVEKVNKSFNVRFLVDDFPLKTVKIRELAKGSSRSLNASWTAIVGKHVIKVEADYENMINETCETNNIAAKESPYIYGAEVSGNTSWETLGLHGLNGTILFEPTQPYDEDEVKITVNLTNNGYLNATNFNVLLFYDYDTPQSLSLPSWEREGWLNRSYPNASWVYIRIIDYASKDLPPWDPMDAGDVVVYNASGNVVLNKANFNDTCRLAQTGRYKSCWIPVEGDTAKVHIRHEKKEIFTVYLYPIYQNETSRLFEGIDVPVNSSHNVSMKRNVSVGDFKVMAVIDPENLVPEDDKTDNIITRIMQVGETRDFTVLNVTAEKTNLSDFDTTDIIAKVANVGYRNGTANVRFVDYEDETRTYKYYYNKSLKWSYLPIVPKSVPLEGYDNLTIIHRPGVDAITLHFNWVNLKEDESKIRICDENGVKIWEAGTDYSKNDLSISVSGATAYIYTNRATIGVNTHNRAEIDIDLGGYTVERKFNEEKVQLNATKTWNESKNITVKWLATTGNHRIKVTVWNNTIKEINETNNTFILTPLEVKASRDVAIVNITLDPEHPDEGEDVNITATVRNNGTKPVTFTADLWTVTTRLISQSELPETKLLNHSNISLAPGENATITGVWENISLYGAPTHVVTAIVDPLDLMDEINESNNELSPVVLMNFSDFNVTRFNQPTREEKNASVTIKNLGARGASNVTVRFYKIVTEPCLVKDGGMPIISITKAGAAKMRLHFRKLDASEEYAVLEVKKNWDDEQPVVDYSGQELPEGVWTPWIEGDTVWIIYSGATFDINKYEWKDVEHTIIKYLNASESVNVTLPERWQKYVKPQILEVSVDPYDNITELNEYNNNGTAVIYADLVLREVGTVFSEDGDLSGI
ncbi:hypothetical protein CW714_08610, partial [Methanophagales archaeon]